jgi:hypothetical protein
MDSNFSIFLPLDDPNKERIERSNIECLSEFSVDVSIEPNHECEIIEVKYDGQEIYKE